MENSNLIKTELLRRDLEHQEVKQPISNNLPKIIREPLNVIKKGSVTYDEGGRDVICSSFIGFNRTGKTELAKKCAIAWRRGNGESYERNGLKYNWILCFDSQGKFRDVDGLVDEYIQLYEAKTWIFEKAMQIRNGLIVLDDYRNLHSSHIMDVSWLHLLAQRTDYNIDIIYITHMPKLVYETLGGYTNYYHIFHTLAGGTFNKNIPQYMLIHNAMRMINAYVKEYGKGKHPYFPYILVDCQNWELKPKNIDRVKFANALKKNNIV